MSSEEAPKFIILPLVQPDEDDAVDTKKIRELTANGLEKAQPEDRCLAWLVLFGIYPSKAREWPDKQEELVATYQNYVKVFKITDWESKSLVAQVIDIDDFGVGDNALMALIHGDVVRTGRHIFMLQPEPDEQPPDDTPINQYAKHLRRLERILYVLGSTNTGLGYMQGFNELVVPIYYTLFEARSLFADVFVVEALSFHCLHQLISTTQICELFMTHDRSQILLERLAKFHEVLKVHVPDVYEVLRKLDIQPVIYCYRWFSLMFSQEYDMRPLQQIWDALFTHFDDLVNFEFYVGCAHIEMIKNDLNLKEYGTAIETLQRAEVRDVSKLLELANKWWRQVHNPTTLDFLQVKFRSLKAFIGSHVRKDEILRFIRRK